MVYPKVKAVQPLDDYRLQVVFDNAVCKVYDCNPLLDKPVFAPLADRWLFRAVRVDPGGYGISWSDDIDLAESELWKHGEPLEIDELLELFGQFLLVLIGLELIHSVQVYIEQREYHLEAILAVALIAVARKIITLDAKALPEGTLLGIAALVIALVIGYYLLQRSRREASQLSKQDAVGAK